VLPLPLCASLSGSLFQACLAGGITGLQEDHPKAKGSELVIYFQYSKYVLILQGVAARKTEEIPIRRHEEHKPCAHAVSLMKRARCK
jgi:hypothetical protein